MDKREDLGDGYWLEDGQTVMGPDWGQIGFVSQNEDGRWQGYATHPSDDVAYSIDDPVPTCQEAALAVKDDYIDIYHGGEGTSDGEA